MHTAEAPIQWEASRQSLTCLSTAESELTSPVSAVQIGQALAALIEEIVGHRLDQCLYGDYQASLAIAQGPTSWRTRHLRIRYFALRDLVQAGEWYRWREPSNRLVDKGPAVDPVPDAHGIDRGRSNHHCPDF